jgi:hypothetical protein
MDMSAVRTAVVAVLATACSAQGADIPTSTVVRFNTVCARCHEGECSGRLTFDVDHMAAANHIRRHAGEVVTDEQKDLHTLLTYMKQRCDYYPMRVAAPPSGSWSPSMLAQLRGPAGDTYFIPLGALSAGRYRARLRFDVAAEACAQVISASFDIGEHPGLKTEGGTMEFEFIASENRPYYLRLQAAKPAVLEMLEIQTVR